MRLKDFIALLQTLPDDWSIVGHPGHPPVIGHPDTPVCIELRGSTTLDIALTVLDSETGEIIPATDLPWLRLTTVLQSDQP